LLEALRIEMTSFTGSGITVRLTGVSGCLLNVGSLSVQILGGRMAPVEDREPPEVSALDLSEGKGAFRASALMAIQLAGIVGNVPGRYRRQKRGGRWGSGAGGEAMAGKK